MQFLLIVIYVLLAGTVTIHVLLTKSDVRAALGWIAVAWLSPVFGAVLYFVFGINRVTRRALQVCRGFPAKLPSLAALKRIRGRLLRSKTLARLTWIKSRPCRSRFHCILHV